MELTLTQRKAFAFLFLILHTAILGVILKEGQRIQGEPDIPLNQKAAGLISFNIFCFFSGITFLVIWLNHQDVRREIPEMFKEKWFGRKDFNDNTMLLLTAALWFWQLITALSLSSLENRWMPVYEILCSTVNSALFLRVSTYFHFAQLPVWVTNPRFNRWFQQRTGIWMLAVLTALITVFVAVAVNWNEKKWNEKSPLPYLADTLFSIAAAFYLFAGLFQLFKERGMRKLRILVWISAIATFFALVLNFPINVQEPMLTIGVGIGYKTSIIILSLALVISYHSSLRKLFLDEKNTELQILRKEVSHRVKNHLRTLLLSIERQLDKYKFSETIEVVSELQAVRARTNAILAVHELLYHPDPQETDLHVIILRDYLDSMISRLRDSFDYPDEWFDYRNSLSDAIPVKASIAPKIGMLITELALNVDQHAYPGKGDKFIGIHIEQKNDWLFISVQDHGKGYEPDTDSRSGHGLDIVHDIAEQFGGKFDPKPTPPGMRAIISIPLKNLI